jgi:hypothetical protein
MAWYATRTDTSSRNVTPGDEYREVELISGPLPSAEAAMDVVRSVPGAKWYQDDTYVSPQGDIKYSTISDESIAEAQRRGVRFTEQPPPGRVWPRRRVRRP